MMLTWNDILHAHALQVTPWLWAMVPGFPDPLAALALAGVGAIIWNIQRKERKAAAAALEKAEMEKHEQRIIERIGRIK